MKSCLMSKPDMPPVLISVVSATYNAGGHLPTLIADLQAQTVSTFQWVIADGGSSDTTLELIAAAGRTLTVRVDARPDFGIYDALNRAIALADGEYYLVIGADDRLAPDAIANYQDWIQRSDADIVSAAVDINGKRVSARPQAGGSHGMERWISSHSVGAVFRKALHDKVGYYSRKFPICADRLFVLKAQQAGAHIVQADFCAGSFSLTGVTGTDVAGLLMEGYRVSRLCGQPRWQQLPLLILRLLKNYRSL